MGTYTGQILIGTGHRNHDGIIPEAQLFLSENSRPVLVLVDVPSRGLQRGGIGYVGWIPTLEHPVDDALLMICVYHLARRNPGRGSRIPELDELVRRVNSCLGSYDLRNDAPPELYSVFTPEQRRELYALNLTIIREHFGGLKLVLTVLDGSLLMHQLPRLKEYGINVEICFTVYNRLTSMWSKGVHEKGDIEKAIAWKHRMG